MSDDELLHKLEVYEHFLHVVELADEEAVAPEDKLADLSAHAHNLLCHLDDGCGH